jgi:DUF4097 and DUF4098 domain-containing protein YvlB
MRYWFTSLLMLATASFGQNSSVSNNGVTKNGAFWERGATSEPVRVSPTVKRVELFTRGKVTVRGSEDGFLRVKVRQQVRADSAQSADRIWGPLRMATVTSNNPGTLRMELYLRAIHAESEIEVSLPRQVPEVWVNNQLGPVQVYDLDGAVRAETGGGHLTVDRVHGNVYAHTGLGDVHLGAIGGSVICSSGGGTVTLASAAGEANCATGGGDISVKSVRGPLILSTEGGNIHVEKAGSTVRAKSMAGLVDVGEARGTVFADSGGGSIQVGSANGVKAESTAGSIRVKGGSGSMSVSTMLGNILAELLAGGRFTDSSLASGSGDIIVTIPAGLGLIVRAREDAGIAPRIVSDFPEIQTKSVNFRSPMMVAQGVINGGGPILDLNANGTIYLRRVK